LEVRRAAIIASLALFACACGTRKCKDKTAHVTLNFDSASSAADTLDITLSVDGAQEQSLHGQKRTAGASTTTMEVDFDNGYPTGKSIEITIVASLDGMIIGSGHLADQLDSGCSAFSIPIVQVENQDLLAREPDLASPIPEDMQTPDMQMPDLQQPDLEPPPPATSSFQFQSIPRYMATVWGKAPDLTFASLTASQIYYTTDTSVPTLSSAHAPSPLTLLGVANNTTIKWFSFNGSQESVQSYVVTITTPSSTDQGYLFEHTDLDGHGPTETVSANATITVNCDLQVWGSTGVSGQVVYAIDTSATGCAFDGALSPFPGVSGHKTFTLTAPSSAGTYNIRVSDYAQANCSAAMGFALTTSHPVIGKIIVQ
jgi:hypothetical protein